MPDALADGNKGDPPATAGSLRRGAAVARVAPAASARCQRDALRSREPVDCKPADARDALGLTGAFSRRLSSPAEPPRRRARGPRNREPDEVREPAQPGDQPQRAGAKQRPERAEIDGGEPPGFNGSAHRGFDHAPRFPARDRRDGPQRSRPNTARPSSKRGRPPPLIATYRWLPLRRRFQRPGGT